MLLLLVRMLDRLLMLLLRSVEATIRLLLEGRVVSSMVVIRCNRRSQGE